MSQKFKFSVCVSLDSIKIVGFVYDVITNQILYMSITYFKSINFYCIFNMLTIIIYLWQSSESGPCFIMVPSVTVLLPVRNTQTFTKENATRWSKKKPVAKQFTKYFKLLFGSNFVHVFVEWPLIDSDLFISTPRFSLILCFGGKEKYTN